MCSRINALVLAAVVGVSGMGARGETGAAEELQALKARIAELEKKQNDNWLTEERASQIKSLVQEVIADSRQRGQFLDGDLQAGYKDGFFVQTADKNFKLVVGAFVQIRYSFVQQNATNGRTAGSRTVGSGSTTPGDPGDANGFDIRRARVNFSGNVWSPDLTYRIEGDFYGGGPGGAFTVTDAWTAYRYSDILRVKAGSFKVPFAKAELVSDYYGMMMDRPEIMTPFDPIRALGLSVYGDIVKDTVSYDVNVNDGSQSNTLRRTDTVGGTANLDNRLAFYSRVQWAGSGKLSEFGEESDLRKDPSPFIWMLGAAGGYESQNATNNAFPSPQNTQSSGGLSTADAAGFLNAVPLNGDMYRGTVDWSGKWQGLSLLTAAYFQQFNYNPGNTSSSSASAISTGPYSAGDSSFFQTGYYGQAGYMVIPQKLEVVGRAGQLLTEGYPNRAEYYSLGLNYYFFGQGAKIQTDVTYSPESALTDAAATQVKDAHNLAFRIQLQLKF